jgi:hypothetical protein
MNTFSNFPEKYYKQGLICTVCSSSVMPENARRNLFVRSARVRIAPDRDLSSPALVLVTNKYPGHAVGLLMWPLRTFHEGANEGSKLHNF